MALLHLQESIINNAATNIFDRVLADNYPQHRKMFKVLSWVERIAFASYVSYMVSANHFKQAERNRQLAVQYGLSVADDQAMRDWANCARVILFLVPNHLSAHACRLRAFPSITPRPSSIPGTRRRTAQRTSAAPRSDAARGRPS